MTAASGVRFAECVGLNSDARFARLLDRAFKVENYVSSFPHIYSGKSAARIFASFDAQDTLVAMCAVDTEIWTEPRFLRGACIGSVAVDPDFQRRGIGRQLLTWVLDELKKQALHDFVYLFSDQADFYESIGFRKAGCEVLYSYSKVSDFLKVENLRYRSPVNTQNLNSSDRARLWFALERGRVLGESRADWSKLQMVLNIPDMIVSWIENGNSEILAGSFFGKGIDFQGVVHTFFSSSHDDLKDYLESFISYSKSLAYQLKIAPGLWSDLFADVLSIDSKQTLCLVKEFDESSEPIVRMIDTGRLYPRAVFSS